MSGDLKRGQHVPDFFSVERLQRARLVKHNEPSGNRPVTGGCVVPQSKKVLVVDDNEDVLKTITKYLEQKNYNVIAVTSGLEALKIFEAEKGDFDLLITDLVMPSISGVAIISIVKERYPKVPIIAITGWGEHPEALATEAKADIVLEKPFELDEFSRIIEELLL